MTSAVNVSSGVKFEARGFLFFISCGVPLFLGREGGAALSWEGEDQEFSSIPAMDSRAEVRVSASPVILPSLESLPSVPSCRGDGLVCEETTAVAAPLGAVYSTCEARGKGKPVATNSDMDMSPDDAWTSREVPRDCADRGDSDGDSLGQCSPSPTSSLQFGDSETCGSSSDKGRGAKSGRRPRSASGSSIGDGGGAGVGPRKGRRACSEGEAAGAVASKKNRATSSPGKKSEARPAMQVTVHPPSQKRKERLRKLRQKREAVAQRKYALLPFTSSSDSSSDSDTDSDTGSTDSSTASSDGPSDVGDSSLGNLVPEQLVDDGPAVPTYRDISVSSSDGDKQSKGPAQPFTGEAR